jgi:hypothetical protein
LALMHVALCREHTAPNKPFDQSPGYPGLLVDGRVFQDVRNCDRVQWEESGLPLEGRIRSLAETYGPRYLYAPDEILANVYSYPDLGHISREGWGIAGHLELLMRTINHSRKNSCTTHSVTKSECPPNKLPPGATGSFIIGSG